MQINSVLLPMATAPADGTEILLYMGPKGWAVGFWDSYGWAPSGVDVSYDMAEVTLSGAPVGWMPLPTEA